MPHYVDDRIADALNSVRKPINGSGIHLFGVAYKKDVNDMRESPALDILELLVRRGAIVSYTDPFVPQVKHGGHVFTSIAFDQALECPFDCAALTTDHSVFDYARLAKVRLIVHPANAL